MCPLCITAAAMLAGKAASAGGLTLAVHRIRSKGIISRARKEQGKENRNGN